MVLRTALFEGRMNVTVSQAVDSSKSPSPVTNLRTTLEPGRREGPFLSWLFHVGDLQIFQFFHEVHKAGVGFGPFPHFSGNPKPGILPFGLAFPFVREVFMGFSSSLSFIHRSGLAHGGQERIIIDHASNLDRWNTEILANFCGETIGDFCVTWNGRSQFLCGIEIDRMPSSLSKQLHPCSCKCASNAWRFMWLESPNLP